MLLACVSLNIAVGTHFDLKSRPLPSYNTVTEITVRKSGSKAKEKEAQKATDAMKKKKNNVLRIKDRNEIGDKYVFENDLRAYRPPSLRSNAL